MKRNDKGFTLVELVVTIAVASIVTAAALSVLLMGMRINKQSNETADRQNTTRVLLSALESMATEGQLKTVENIAAGWTVLGENDQVLFFYVYDYDDGYGTVYTSNGVEILTGLQDSTVELSDNNLVTFSVTTESGTYTSSAYCRQAVGGKTDADDGTAGDVVGDLTDNDTTNDAPVSGTIKHSAQRNEFLKVLASQFQFQDGSPNTGLILEKIPTATGNTIIASKGTYYSQWYAEIKGYSNVDDWGKGTPWCACYVSWGIYQVKSDLYDVPIYANVDDFLKYFVDSGKWNVSKYWTELEKNEVTYELYPGDLVFFDWIVNNEKNPQHVGVVLGVGDDFIYTIEGNSSGKVSLRRYDLDDPRILGYGVLPWSDSETK